MAAGIRHVLDDGGDMAQKLDLKIRGLYTNPNAFSEAPQGALAVADDVVIEKESVAEPRRGQNFYGSQLPFGELKKLFNYKSSLISHDGTRLLYDSGDGDWIAYAGDYIEPDNAVRIRSLESNRNFYFTTDKGIHKIDALNATPRLAGAPKGLDGLGETTGGSGFFEDGKNVAYRIVWGYKDLSNNLILGAPSQRIIVQNTAGGSRNVELTFTVPAEVNTEYFYQIYRSTQTLDLISEPSDEMQLVQETYVSSGQISAKEVVAIDNTPEDLKGATLYTSPSQEGILQANEQPPYAVDMDLFKGFVFYANTKSKNRFSFTLISVGFPSFGYQTASGETTEDSYVVENTTTLDLRVGMRIVGDGIPDDTYIESIDSASQLTMTNQATITQPIVGLDFQDRLSIAGVDYFGGATNDFNKNQFKIDVSGTPAENIDTTALNLIEVVNKSPSNTLVYAYYLSGYSDLPGKIQIEERTIGGDQYDLNSSYGVSFSPELPDRKNIISINDTFEPNVESIDHGLVTGDSIYIFGNTATPSLNSREFKVTVIDADNFTLNDVVTETSGVGGYFVKAFDIAMSDNNEQQNAVYFSKSSQPEAVPLLSYILVGSANFPIRRVVALRDSVFVFKDDGIFRITGEDPTNFRETIFDNTAFIRASESAVAFNNQVFLYSNQGIIAVSDTGVPVMSRPIEDVVLKLSSEQYTNFASQSFGVSYESGRKYIFFTVTRETDTYATQAWVYNMFTNAWTRWKLTRSCGIVNKADDKLYMGNPLNNYVYKERKDYTLNDYSDEEYTVRIQSIAGNVLTLMDASNVKVDMTISQGVRKTMVTEVDGNDVTVVDVSGFVTGIASALTPLNPIVEWLPIDIENPAILKQFREITILFRDAAFYNCRVEFKTNFSNAYESTYLFPRSQTPYGSLPFGGGPFGGGLGGEQPLRTFVPLEKQRASWLNLRISTKQALTNFGLSGVSIVFNPMESRFF